MEKIEFHPDFKDFLKLLNSHGVEYLVVGGYAVGLHGYPRATGNIDVWIAAARLRLFVARMRYDAEEMLLRLRF